MLFIEDNDYLTMLALIKERAKEFNLEVFAFCLMPNHFHLLLRIREPNLSAAMHSLNTSYGMRFNKKYQRKGHVFCGVYRASNCLDDVHLIGSSIYIHLNPEKAGIIKHALGYRWSSASLYAKMEIKSFVKLDFILKIISENLQEASCVYKKMLINSSKVPYDNIMEIPKAGLNFSKSIFKNLLEILPEKTIRKDFISAEITLDEMIEEFRNKKQRNKPEDKSALIYLVGQLKSRRFNMTEIAQMLNINRRTLYYYTNKVQP
jgi:putative transposase